MASLGVRAHGAMAHPAVVVVALFSMLHVGVGAVALYAQLAPYAGNVSHSVPLVLAATDVRRHWASLNASALRGSAARLQRSRRLLAWMFGRGSGDQHAADGADLGTADPPSDNATCRGSGYLIDWGSSGMKVYRVHRPVAPAAHELLAEHAVVGSLKSYKLHGVSVASPTTDVQAILDSLAQRLPGGTAGGMADGAGGAMLATASLRLDPERADHAWDAVRAWAGAHPGVLGRCGGVSDNADCRTLAGFEEASYELRSALRSSPGRELQESGRPFGFASAGGASLQLGVRGPEAELRHCLQDLHAQDSHFDPQRSGVTSVNGMPTLVVSFLSITRLRARTCVNTSKEEGCEYDVGGLDQMRARFDEFLVAQGMSANPCLSPHTQPKPDRACRFFGSTTCVIDRYGGKISGLPPANGSLAGADRMQQCHRQVSQFLGDDIILGRWASSQSCQGLAGNATRWALMSSFARKTQLGADVGQGWEAFGSVKQAAMGLGFATDEEVGRGEEGILLSSMMLVGILETLGVSTSAGLQGVMAEWADEAMRERGLARGWALPDHCPGESRSASAPPRWAVALAGWMLCLLLSR
mmetsp:Transcript_73882/g.228246  ORF Transcript_73882/g.228246 Transcript_73882/m.228246 type:complete len:586 (-) Transcript_73882:172-1929(-)